MDYIKIEVTEGMEQDYARCGVMAADGQPKECDGCSCNGGALGCLGEHVWYQD